MGQNLAIISREQRPEVGPHYLAGDGPLYPQYHGGIMGNPPEPKPTAPRITNLGKGS